MLHVSHRKALPSCWCRNVLFSTLSGFDGTVTVWCGYLVFYVLPDDVVVYLVYDFLDLCMHCVVVLGVM